MAEYDYIVYADVLWLVNFMMDFALLWCVAKFGHFSFRYWRLLLASAVGGLYGVGLVLPSLAWAYGLLGKLAFPVLMLLIIFGYQSPRRLLKQVVYLFLIGFAMSGAVMGGSVILGKSGFEVDSLSIVFLLFALGVVVALTKFSLAHLKGGWQKQALTVACQINFNGNRATLQTLLDTGNSLEEPWRGLPVVVAAYSKLKTSLPQELQNLWEAQTQDDPLEIIAALAHHSWVSRLCVIPYSSVGQSRGLLLGIKTDFIAFKVEKRSKIFVEKAIVAICDAGCGFDFGDYDSIVNPVILEVGSIKEPGKSSGWLGQKAS